VSSMLWKVKIARMMASMKALSSSDRGNVSQISFDVTLRRIQPQKALARTKGKTLAQSRFIGQS
jgi:hypothetical protein